MPLHGRGTQDQAKELVLLFSEMVATSYYVHDPLLGIAGTPIVL